MEQREETLLPNQKIRGIGKRGSFEVGEEGPLKSVGKK